MAGNDASHNQDQHHTKVLRALHGEILAYGLSPIDVNSSIGEGGDGGAGGAFSQSASGAFPPLHYTYRPDDGRATREVVIRALAMFDELIVTATVTVSAKEAEAAVTPLSPSAAAASATEICPPSAAAPSRRVTFDITRWLLLGDDKEGDEAATGVSAQRQHKDGGEGGDSEAAHVATTGPSMLREAFRSRVLSGLLLHLCPPSGQFADFYGVEEGLRWRVLEMLGARDLATFSLTSRAAAVSAAADSLWAPLVAFEFSEREQHAVLFLESSSNGGADDSGDSATVAKDSGGGGSDGGDRGSDHRRDRTAAAAVETAAVGGSAKSLSGGDAEISSRNEGESSCRVSEDGLVAAVAGDGCGGGGHQTAGTTSRKTSGSSSSSSSSSHDRHREEGASRRLFVKLHSARTRRAAIANEQRRRSSILEMSALGRLGRTWGLYPWAPYPPRGPYHTPGAALQEYDWGPGVRDPIPDGVDGSGLPQPAWGGGGGWGRSRTGSWRAFGGGGAGGGVCPGGFGGGGGRGSGWGAGQAGVPPPSYGQSRRSRGQFAGHLAGLSDG